MTAKAMVYLVLEVLKEYSDEKHPLNASQVSEKIEEKYGLSPDRRTIYSAVELLTELGFDISKFEENGKGFYLRGRQFEPEEARLLINAVYNFPFISEKQTKELVSKLQLDFSVYDRRACDEFTIIKPEIKSLNKEVFYNISLIAEAIEKKKKISFTYLDYGPDLKLRPKREKKYTVNPYGTVYLNEHYYLACTYAFQPNASLYRIDMMKDIVIKEKYDIDKPLSKTEVKKEIDNAVFGQVGKPESFTIRCDKKCFRDVVDKFGSNIIVSDEGDCVRATVHCTRLGMTYWALQYLQHIEVLSPADFRQELVDILKNNRYVNASGKE